MRRPELTPELVAEVLAVEARRARREEITAPEDQVRARFYRRRAEQNAERHAARGRLLGTIRGRAVRLEERVRMDAERQRWAALQPGERLAALREAAGLSKTEMGEQAGLVSATVGRLEAGHQRLATPSSRKLLAAWGLTEADVLESTSLDDLRGRTDPSEVRGPDDLVEELGPGDAAGVEEEAAAEEVADEEAADDGTDNVAPEVDDEPPAATVTPLRPALPSLSPTAPRYLSVRDWHLARAEEDVDRLALAIIARTHTGELSHVAQQVLADGEALISTSLLIELDEALRREAAAVGVELEGLDTVDLGASTLRAEEEAA